MANLEEFKTQNPAYKDIPDQELAVALHKKYYSSIPEAEYFKKIGLTSEPKTEDSTLKQIGQFAMGLPQAAGNKFVGAVQTATDIIAPDSPFAKNLAKEVGNLKQKQAKLPLSERAGIAAGEIGYDLLLSPNKGSLAMQGARSAGISGLTTPLEQNGAEGRVKEAAKDAAIGATLGKGIEYAGKGADAVKEEAQSLYKGFKARLPEELQAVGKSIKEKASSLYQSVRDSGTVLRPEATQEIIGSIEKSLSKDGEIVTKHLHGDTLKTISQIKEDIAGKDNLISLPELDQYRQLLNETIRKNTSKIDGANPDAVKAITAKNQLDRIVGNLNPKYLIESGNPEAMTLLNAARGEWGKAAKFEKISNIVEKADGDPNRIKTLMRNFVTNKNNLKGYSSEEIAALKNAATSSVGEKLLKMGGKFGVDTNASFTSTGNILPAAELYFGGLKSGGTSVAVGTLARSAQKYIARGKLDDALKIIQGSRNPAEIISKIPDRKAQEKILNQLLTKGTALTAIETTKQ